MKHRVSLDGTHWRLTDLVPSEWAWLRLDRPETDLSNLMPPVPPWRTATVPGDVQSDLLDAGEQSEPWRDLNSRAWEWTSQRDWLYWTELPPVEWAEGRQAVLHFEGVDYACHVFVNGIHVGDHEGTYVPCEFDVTRCINAGEPVRVVVVVEHAPVEPDQQAQIGWTEKVRLWKPRFAYKWDWCTRLIPLGLWDSVYLDLWDDARITGVRLRSQLCGSLPACAEAELGVAVTVASNRLQRLTLTAAVVDPEGLEVATTCQHVDAQEGGAQVFDLTVTIPHPRLWWPNGMGEQPLYEVRVAVAGDNVLDACTMRTGFRRVRAVPNEHAPADALPYTLEVNGRRVFARGWNWAPVNQLYGRPHRERYEHAIRLARDAHCNLLRVWGGGLLEREIFYDLCDRAGIMVWQEFPQSSSGIQNEPARDEAYVRYCAEQARLMVPRRAHHPSLVIWCGGNELMDEHQKPCDMDHPVLATLGKVVAELDPDRIYLPASPSGPVFAADPKNAGNMHDVHGHWLYMGDPGHYAFYNTIDPLFHSEFGCEGAANLEALLRFLSPEYHWPPDRSNPAWVHHGAWWLHREKVEASFGRVDDLREFVYASQWIQYEGLRYAAEASRRRKWRTSGCAPWQFNESWPNTSCTNCLGYFGDVKPAYWAMRGAYAPVAVSARYERMHWEPGSVLEAELWLNVSDPALVEESDAVVRWTLHDLQGGLVDNGEYPAPAGCGASALHVGRIEVVLPEPPGVFGLVVQLDVAGGRRIDQCGCDKRYIFTTLEPPALQAVLRMPRIDLEVRQEKGGWVIIGCPLDAAAPAMMVRMDPLNGHAGPYPGWGYAPFLLPGESIGVEVDGKGQVRIEALNASPRVIEV